jgi:hypothetical protein
MTAGAVDDREATMAEGTAVVVPEAVAVRAAMGQARRGSGDRRDVAFIKGTVEGHEAGYSAHGIQTIEEASCHQQPDVGRPPAPDRDRQNRVGSGTR